MKFKRTYRPKYTLVAEKPSSLWNKVAIISAVVVIFLVIGVVTSNNKKAETNVAQNNTQISQTAQEKPKSQASASTIPSNLPSYYVSRVVDGDTIVVSDGASEQKVRMIGIDTPETKNPKKPVECFGPESSNYLTSLLAGKIVQLESDSTQSNADVYGRLLRYVYYDNQNVNLLMISSGYAFEYLFNNPYKYHDVFVRAENEARNSQKGLWSPSTCGGQR
ncbi:thermonuclease family protein [Candidatus Saccharibacteria bacterium]|nr:thermonuclease family protein [Candidatus Saccharibacteria bacterium]